MLFKKWCGRLLAVVLISNVISFFGGLTVANAAQDAECVIGSSSSCPATSPQEIYNLYGTTSDGTYWIKISGTATQVYLMMNRTGSDNGSWILLMKGTKTSTNFDYSST